MIDGKNPGDLESMAAFNSLGQPMKEMYEKEVNKYKRDEQDQQDLLEALKRAHNVDVVDF